MESLCPTDYPGPQLSQPRHLHLPVHSLHSRLPPLTGIRNQPNRKNPILLIGNSLWVLHLPALRRGGRFSLPPTTTSSVLHARRVKIPLPRGQTHHPINLALEFVELVVVLVQGDGARGHDSAHQQDVDRRLDVLVARVVVGF